MSITYTLQGDRVTLEMTRDDFDNLTLAVAIACAGAMRDNNKTLFYRWLAFANALNATNPNWTPYEIPQEVEVRAAPQDADQPDARL